MIVGSNPTDGMDVYLLCLLSGRGLCDELITIPEKSYRLWRAVVSDPENLTNDEGLRPLEGISRQKQNEHIRTTRTLAS